MQISIDIGFIMRYNEHMIGGAHMPKRLTIEYVKEFVKEKTDGECEVISESYINNSTPLQIRCRCGKIFERNFNKLRERDIMCVDCSRELSSTRQRKNVEEIIRQINLTGCKYVSGEYKNNQSILTIQCRCGNIFKKSYAKFSTGQDRCPECGKKSLIKSKTKYGVDFVKDEIAKKGYTMVDEKEYKDSTTPFKCICKRGHLVDIKFLFFLRNESGCSKCAVIDSRNKASWHYKGGRCSVNDSLRDVANSWKKKIKKSYGNVCAITGEKPERLVVHHLYSYNKLVEQASKNTGVPILEKLSDYENQNDFYVLKDELRRINDTQEGIPMLKRIHNEFHSEYGKQDNTPEQFNQFLIEHYNTDLQKIRNKQLNN